MGSKLRHSKKETRYISNVINHTNTVNNNQYKVNMKVKNHHLLIILIALMSFSSCKKEPPITAQRHKKTIVLMGDEDLPLSSEGGHPVYEWVYHEIGDPHLPIAPETLIQYDANHNIIYSETVYNCHTYVWGPPSSSDPGYIANLPNWNNAPLNHTTGYHTLGFSDPNQVGDRIIYYQVNPSTGQVEPSHSALVTGVDADGNCTEATSKWGQQGVYVHNPRDVPSDYSVQANTFTYHGVTYPSRVYYRKN
ncbi:hypothetical protein [Pedobacter borealis]|uniref:hypothetical protein n=1 Tax=Pedobacter borealis TaxID=475254 RepID=UPI0004935095|nr:hypothetical protein [Pedobacter borealis]